MPRASYGDRHCVSVLQGQTLATLDFTSRVIDFFTVQNPEVPEGGGSRRHRVPKAGGVGAPLAAPLFIFYSFFPLPQASRTPAPLWCWWRRSWW